jgi:hypothetical protein
MFTVLHSKKGKDGGRMKAIFARWLELERRKVKRIVAIALALLAVVMLGVLVWQMLDGYVILPEKRFTWQPATRITIAEKMYIINKTTNTAVLGDKNVYVYECDPNDARIEPNGWMKSGYWVSREKLEPDVCKDGQP